jgi:O-antigen biosynthesis protein
MVAIPFTEKLRQVRQAIRGGVVESLVFDHRAYRAKYLDVAATAPGRADALEHYFRWGRWEGRELAVRWRLPQDVLAWAHGAEALAQGMLARARPWELAHRFRAPGDERRVFGHFSPLSGDPPTAPWFAPLPAWATPTGWCQVLLEADVPPDGTRFSIHASTSGASPGAGALILNCLPGRAAVGVVRLPRGAVDLVVRPTGLGLGRMRSCRLKPLPWATAKQRMLAALATPPSREQLRRNLLQMPYEDALWSAYCAAGESSSRPTYADWIERVERPRHRLLEECVLPGIGPKISVLVPVHDPPPELLRACLQSVLDQRYDNWELCISDDGSRRADVRDILGEFEQACSRARIVRLPESGHISRASNAALELATGEYVALLDHDDMLGRYALLEAALAIREQPRVKVLYSDEDKIDASGDRHQPHFKPGFDPDRLLGQNYFGHLLVIEARLLREIGGFRPGYEGAQDHDLVLRCTEAVESDQIVHLPQVLYHWREATTSTALDPGAKPYASAAGMAAVREALARRGLRARVSAAASAHSYRVTWDVPNPAPKVAVVIPTRDCVSLLEICLEGLLDRTSYPNVELVIIDNGSVGGETHRFFRRVEQRAVRVLRYDRPFNFAAINNFAVASTRSDLVALVNNDIEVLDPGWLEEMVGHAIRPEVGAVGALLLYPDRRIQHAGVVLGIGGVAGHAFKYAPAACAGYFSSLHFARSVSAVTAACLVVERSKYEAVGGLDEELAVAFNDVDFCMRLGRAGYRNVFTPHAVLLHHESASRGDDLTGEKLARFQRERLQMLERWGGSLRDDPFYSPHLTLDHEDYSFRRP